jgi:hypothetical protein
MHRNKNHKFTNSRTCANSFKNKLFDVSPNVPTYKANLNWRVGLQWTTLPLSMLQMRAQAVQPTPRPGQAHSLPANSEVLRRRLVTNLRQQTGDGAGGGRGVGE